VGRLVVAMPGVRTIGPHDSLAIRGRLNWPFAHSGVAQLAARMILVHEVGGSSPPPRALAAIVGGGDWTVSAGEAAGCGPFREGRAGHGPIV